MDAVLSPVPVNVILPEVDGTTFPDPKVELPTTVKALAEAFTVCAPLTTMFPNTVDEPFITRLTPPVFDVAR